ncbi:MAG: DUF2059 domain-containing protein [Sphingobium sp.]
MRTIPLFLALAAPAGAVFAAPPPAPSPAATADAPAPDPARLAAATRAVAALVPEGIYVRMMRDQFPAMMDAMMVQMMGMKGEDFGQKDADGKTMAELTRESDPAFEERMKIMTGVMSRELGTVMGEMEPAVRAGLSRAFARRFTVGQLNDMNAFFATPSGKAFADDYLLMFADPEMTREMAALTPRMMRAMPEIMKKAEAATAHLPPPPRPESGN